MPASAPQYVTVVRPHVHRYPTMRTTTSPAGTRPGQVIIIPKRLMDKKIKDVEGEKPLKVVSSETKPAAAQAKAIKVASAK